MSEDDLKRAFGAYVASQKGWHDRTVLSVVLLEGGISRETWRVVLLDGAGKTSAIILRIDPPGSLLESSRHKEAAIYRALSGDSGVPVPTVIWVEDNDAHLGATFLATTLLPGTADQKTILDADHQTSGKAIARDHFEILGKIAKFESAAKEVFPAPSAPAWKEALDHWEAVFDAAERGPQPVVRAAIRFLRRNPPRENVQSMVHGDYRLGNLLFLPDGKVTGVLDWEMAHMGDPLEDLAWAIHHQWRLNAAPDLVAGYLDESEAIAIWEQSSGRRADPEDLVWWRLLVCVKAMGLWATSVRNLVEGKSGQLKYLHAALNAAPNDEEEIIRLLGVRVP